MKKLFLFLFLLFTTKVNAQQSLIQVNSWNAYVHLPWDYNTTPTKRYPTIIFFPGLGEIGTNPSAVIANGPGAYITQGWNGNIKVNADSVKFIVVSLQPPTAYPGATTMDTRIQTLKSLYRIDTTRLYLTGLSHGGACSGNYVTYSQEFANRIAAVVTVDGVTPNSNLSNPCTTPINCWGTPPNNCTWPCGMGMFRYPAFARSRYLSFRQITSGVADLSPKYCDTMNSYYPNTAINYNTSFGGGAHCCWNQWYGGQGVQPQTFLLDGINQNIYEWMARQSINQTVLALDTTTFTPPRPDRRKRVYYHNSTLHMKNVGKITVEIFDVTGRTYYIKLINNNLDLNLSHLPSGTYIVRYNQEILKFIK